MEVTDFQNKVYRATKKIPKGRVSTYGELARAIKNPDSARAVGNALNKNPYAPTVPCHRIVKSDGSLGGFESGPDKKISILKKENTIIINNKVKDFKNKFFKIRAS